MCAFEPVESISSRLKDDAGCGIVSLDTGSCQAGTRQVAERPCAAQARVMGSAALPALCRAQMVPAAKPRNTHASGWQQQVEARHTSRSRPESARHVNPRALDMP